MAKLTKEQKFIHKRHEDAKKQLKEKLDEITSREPSALTETQVKFLRARRSYLTGDQIARFEEVLGEEVVPEPQEAPAQDSAVQKQLNQAMKTIADLKKKLTQKTEVENTQDTGEGYNDGQVEGSDADESYRKIQQKAAQLGINPVGKSRDELVKLISQEGANQRDAKK